MHIARLAALSVGVSVLAGCSGAKPTENAPAQPTLSVLNATPWSIRVETDRVVTIPELAASLVSSDVELTPTAHEIGTIWNDGSFEHIARLSFALSPSTHYNVFAYSPGGDTLSSGLLLKDDAAVPPGKVKLRVLHLAPSAPSVEMRYSTNGGALFADPFFLFNFSNTPSAYVTDKAGSWIVQATKANQPAYVLATTGPIDLPDGARRTVALVDSSGVLRLRVLVE